jgi:cell division protein FtsW
MELEKMNEESTIEIRTPERVRRYRLSKNLLIATFLILLVGGQICSLIVESIFSLSVNNDLDITNFLVKRLIIIGISFVIFYICYKIKPQFWEHSITTIYLIASLFSFVLLMLMGDQTGDSKSSFTIGGFTLQPLEFLKIFVIIAIANSLDKNYDKPFFQKFGPSIIFAFITIGIMIGVANDKGTSLIVILFVAAMFFAAQMKKRYLAVGLTVIGAGGIGLSLLSTSIRQRIMAVIGSNFPSTGLCNGNDACDQLKYSRYAFYHGGLFGSGNSLLPYQYLPAAHNDFVLAVLADVGGLVLVAIVIILFALMLFTIIQFTNFFYKKFYKFTMIGITCWFGFQTIINMLVVLNLFPPLGVNLPFISAGGSNQLAFSVAYGIVACYIKMLNESYDKRTSETVVDSVVGL